MKMSDQAKDTNIEEIEDASFTNEQHLYGYEPCRYESNNDKTPGSFLSIETSITHNPPYRLMSAIFWAGCEYSKLEYDYFNDDSFRMNPLYSKVKYLAKVN